MSSIYHLPFDHQQERSIQNRNVLLLSKKTRIDHLKAHGLYRLGNNILVKFAPTIFFSIFVPILVVRVNYLFFRRRGGARGGATAGKSAESGHCDE